MNHGRHGKHGVKTGQFLSVFSVSSVVQLISREMAANTAAGSN